MAAMLALSQRLSTGPAPVFAPSKAKSVFFDVAGYFMVRVCTALDRIFDVVKQSAHWTNKGKTVTGYVTWYYLK